MFPEQLTGPKALSTWQVKKVFSGGFAARAARRRADCTTGFVPAGQRRARVAGVWTGYDSPYPLAGGNVQGSRAGLAQELGAGRPGGRARLSDAEPPHVPGPAARRAARASA